MKHDLLPHEVAALLHARRATPAPVPPRAGLQGFAGVLLRLSLAAVLLVSVGAFLLATLDSGVKP